MPARSARRRRHVFVSHSGADAWVATQIAREIRRCGAVPFLDENDVDVGAEFEEQLLESISKADELVVLLTPWALKRPYVWVEIGAAWGRRIPIVVLLHGLSAEELQHHPDVPVLLKKRDLISLNQIELYLTQLRRRVGARKRSENEP